MSPEYVSRYDARVELVRKTLQDAASLDDKAARDVAVRILQALDRLPEQVR